MRRLPILLLAAVLVASLALNAHRATNPTSGYQSADERSYGKLAIDIAENGTYGSRATRMTEPLHWPPGAPLLFAAGHVLFGDPASEATYDLPVAYWSHALLAVGDALGAFALAWILAGVWPGVIAAALVGLYPPLILATGEQVSEPFGAFLLLWGLVALAWGGRTGRVRWLLVGGALLGGAVLTRTDLLLVPFLCAAVWALARFWPQRQWRPAAAQGLAIGAAAAAVMLPWVIYASLREDRPVPVTVGSAAPLFVGTYLPGDGRTVGMKRALEEEVKRFRPQLRPTPAFEIEARHYMDLVASRYPALRRDEAIRRAARRNLSRYVREDPVGYAAMTLDKVKRMWGSYARGGARHTSPWIRAWHVTLVLAAFAGILAAAVRRRSLVVSLVLVAAVWSTALHMIVVANARYNLTLMPAVLAAGVAAWWLVIRPASPPPASPGRPHPPAPG